MSSLFHFVNRILARIGYGFVHINDDKKYQTEIKFWERTLFAYINWYQGELNPLFGEPPPTESQKVVVNSLKDSAILTWEQVHQGTKYLQDLELQKNAFEGTKLLDIGSGPHPSARVFSNCEVYCLDPLLPAYISAGFPLHYYDQVKFVHGFAEKIQVADNFFDAVISVNALDHVDDFFQSASEIKRVLNPTGKIRLHLHYHKATSAEPIELNDQIVRDAFQWCDRFVKIGESKSKRGHTLTEEGESYTLWSNF